MPEQGLATPGIKIKSKNKIVILENTGEYIYTLNLATQSLVQKQAAWLSPGSSLETGSQTPSQTY